MPNVEIRMSKEARMPKPEAPRPCSWLTCRVSDKNSARVAVEVVGSESAASIGETAAMIDPVPNFIPPPDPNSGWDEQPRSLSKFMVWALVVLIVVFGAVGLLVRVTSGSPG
jgi:hypothetical protein